MARIYLKRRKRLREIERRAGETADPVERLRYVRGEMNGAEPPERFPWRPLISIAALVAAAIGAALLLWRIR